MRTEDRLRLFAGMMCVVTVAAFLIQNPCALAGGTNGTTGQQARSEKINRQLAGAWTALYDGNLEKGIERTTPLIRLSDDRRYRWAALEGAHIQARFLWKRDNRQSRSRASSIWKTLAGASTRNSVKQRRTIVRALKLSASLDPSRPPAGQPQLTEAIGLLEGILKRNLPNTATVEAAILLGRLRADAGRFKEARKVLSSVIKQMNNEKRVSRIEIPPPVAKAFREAAKKIKNGLAYRKGYGRKQYEQARKLQKEASKTTGKEQMKKYARAIRLYRQVAGQFPESDYAPRSRLQIGHCLVGMDRPGDAVSHWNGFITDDKCGKMRGQAYVGLIDLLLEERLDLEGAAKYAEMAREVIAEALKDEESAPSWKKAARALWLRIGLVSLCRGQDSVASEAFGKTKDRTKSRFKRECLARLIRLAETGQPLIPTVVQAGSGSQAGAVATKSPSETIDGPALALTIGMVHTLAGSYEAAEKFFERVSGREATEDRRGQAPMRGATAAQVAFAEFGKANLLEIHNQPEKALQHYRTSLERYPPKKSANGTYSRKSRTDERARGTTQKSVSDTSSMHGRTQENSLRDLWEWHDETLYRVGMLMEELAEGKGEKIEKGEKTEKRNRGASASRRGRTKKNASGTTNESANWHQEERRRRMARRHRIAEAKAEALPVWHRLAWTYPESPRAQVARYHRATLRHGLAETVVGGVPEKTWESVADGLKRFCEQHPESWRTGRAAVRWTEVALERLFDRDRAAKAAEVAVKWAKRARDRKNEKSEPDALPAWYRPENTPTFAELKPVIHRCYFQAGLAAYLDERYGRARAMLKEAGRIGAPRPYEVVGGDVPTGTERLMADARAEKPPVPAKVRRAGAEPALALGLAGLYFRARRWDRARRLYHRVYDGNVGSGSKVAIGWATFMIGRTHYWEFELERARSYYMEVFRKYPHLPWAARALLYNAAMAHTSQGDSEEARECLNLIRRHYPKGSYAERATYLTGQLHQQDGNFEQAQAAYAQYLGKYPGGTYAELIREKLLPQVKRGRTGLGKRSRTNR